MLLIALLSFWISSVAQLAEPVSMLTATTDCDDEQAQPIIATGRYSGVLLGAS